MVSESAHSNSEDNPGYIERPHQIAPTAERPSTVFLSYARANVAEVERLQQELQLRGVRAWRDVTDLALGSYTEDEIVRAIEQEADGFVLFVTPESLTSRFIWNVEVPAAIRRWARERSFGIIPVFRNVTVAQLQQFSTERGYPLLTDFNGAFVPERGRDETEATVNAAVRSVAQRILDATLRLRLRRAVAGHSYEPSICLRTFAYVPPTPSLDLDLDWTSVFTGRSPSPTEWQTVLLPALTDVKDSLSQLIRSRRLRLFVQARLPAALALGAAFPATAHFALSVEGRHGIWSTTVPDSIGPLLHRTAYDSGGNLGVAVVEVAIARETAPTVTRSLPRLGLSFRHRIRFAPPDGPSDSAVEDGTQALAFARQIGQELKRLRDREGVQHVHLFAALPAALAVFLGYQLNASTAVTAYYTNEAGLYVPAYTIGSIKPGGVT